MVVQYKLQIKAVLHAHVVKNLMLQNCGIDAHRRLSRLLTRPSTCYEAQYGRHFSLTSEPEQKSAVGPHPANIDLGD